MCDPKKDKEVKREQLVAFLRGHNLDEDRKANMTKIKIDELREKIVEKWEELKPTDCDQCGKFYRYLPDHHITHRCSICSKGMCPDCCTSDKLRTYEESQVKNLLHLI